MFNHSRDFLTPVVPPCSNLGANSRWAESSGLPEPVCEADTAGGADCPVQGEARGPPGTCRQLWGAVTVGKVPVHGRTTLLVKSWAVLAVS